MCPIEPSLVSEWRSLPAEVRYHPASQAQIEVFEMSHGAIPASFRVFLEECGGGVVGGEWIDGIEQLPRSHVKFNRERSAGGWEGVDGFLIGWDGAGNPLLLDQAGRVVVADHNFGGVHKLAETFEEYLARGLRNAL